MTLSPTGGLTQTTDGLAVDRSVVLTTSGVDAMEALMLTWASTLPVASSNPDDPAPVPSGKFYKLGPGGPFVIAQ